MNLSQNAKCIGAGAFIGGIGGIFSGLVTEGLVSPIVKAMDIPIHAQVGACTLSMTSFLFLASYLALRDCVAGEEDKEVESKASEVPDIEKEGMGRKDVLLALGGYCAAAMLCIYEMHHAFGTQEILPYTPDQGNETFAQEVIGAVKTIKNIAGAHGLNLP
jgi:hypothetical protein